MAQYIYCAIAITVHSPYPIAGKNFAPFLGFLARWQQDRTCPRKGGDVMGSNTITVAMLARMSFSRILDIEWQIVSYGIRNRHLGTIGMSFSGD